TEKSGLNSGMMIVQYVAAGYASDNKVLAHPASADSIPTSANQEDFVPMGMAAALKARQSLENAAYVVALEVLAAAQGLEFLKPLQMGQRVSRSATSRFAFSWRRSETSIWAIISCVYSLLSNTRWETIWIASGTEPDAVILSRTLSASVRCAPTAGISSRPSVSASPRMRTRTSFARPFPTFSTVTVASVHSFRRTGPTSTEAFM